MFLYVHRNHPEILRQFIHAGRGLSRSRQKCGVAAYSRFFRHSRDAVRIAIIVGLACVCGTVPAVRVVPKQPDATAALRWRSIGPSRAGRARALAGVPGNPTVFYVGFDNGGLWRSTDFGSTWEPLFDSQPTGSIGAIAVAPSDPNIIYVGTGAGIIRPDLATGNGIYKSTDGGRTWTHLGGLDSTLMIAMVDVDPKNPDRLFVAALGHPYGSNVERGIYRSTDGGRTFDKVLYKDEYTSGNDVRIDPSNPNTVYAALWQQQQTFWEASTFGPDSMALGEGGIYKSTDGGTTWALLGTGLPHVLEANLAIAPSNPQVIYAMVAAVNPAGGSGPVGFYKSSDGGAHWTMRTHIPGAAGDTSGTGDPRPLTRIGGGGVPTNPGDPKNAKIVYSASIVMWRTEDGGTSWSAVRGSPGGDDYQKIWVNPDDPNTLLVVSDQGAVISSNRGTSWSNWYTQSTAAVYHVTADNAFPYMVCSGQQDSGSLCVASRSDDGEITFHDWHPANIQEYGIAAPDPRDPDIVFGSARRGVSRYDRRSGQTAQVGPDSAAPGDKFGRNVRTMPLIWSPGNKNVLYYTSNLVWRSVDRAHTWTRISPDLARQTWAVPPSAGKYASGVTPTPRGAITALSPSPRSAAILWAGTDDGNIQVTMNGGVAWKNVTPPEIHAWTRIFNIEAGHFDTRTAYAAANTLRIDDMRPHFWRTHDGGRTWTEINGGIAPGAVSNSIREDPRVPGLLYAATDAQVWLSLDDGGHWQSLRLNMPAISVRDIQVKDDSSCVCADLIAGTHGRGFWVLDNLSPLRHRATSRGEAFLVKPQTAVRVRFGTNEPTPWPPELPAGENPPAGALLDYFLPAEATRAVGSAGALCRAPARRRPHPPPASHAATGPADQDAGGGTAPARRAVAADVQCGSDGTRRLQRGASTNRITLRNSPRAGRIISAGPSSTVRARLWPTGCHSSPDTRERESGGPSCGDGDAGRGPDAHRRAGCGLGAGPRARPSGGGTGGAAGSPSPVVSEKEAGAGGGLLLPLLPRLPR